MTMTSPSRSGCSAMRVPLTSVPFIEAVREHERTDQAAFGFGDLGHDLEVAPLAPFVDVDQHLDRPDEVVPLVARVLAHRVLELTLQDIGEPGEPFGVFGREVHGEAVRHDGAAHAERAPRVDLAHEPVPDLDGLHATAERLGERPFDEPLEPSLEALESH